MAAVAQVTGVSMHAVWVLLGDEEFMLPFQQFPRFKDATIAQIHDLRWPTPDHLYWPQLDIDISVESIRHPEEFPLRSQ